MDLNKNGVTLTNDTIKGLHQIAYGGSLQLALSGNGLAPNDASNCLRGLLRAASPDLAPATPGPGLAWNTSPLLTNGTLLVIANPIPAIAERFSNWRRDNYCWLRWICRRRLLASGKHQFVHANRRMAGCRRRNL